jgi:L-aminopeptidase/D-esterase-like protein
MTTTGAGAPGNLAPAGAITDVPGVYVGHADDDVAGTGVTVALFEPSAVGAGLILGGAVSTRGFESVTPGGVTRRIHGVCFAGGSTFGLGASGGVLRYLRERGRGLVLDELVIPLVPTAILFDLLVGTHGAHPTEEMAYRACVNAGSAVAEGNVGAGMGAIVGKLLREPCAMAGGVGTASLSLGNVVVGALAVVNAFGDVRDPATGRILAGVRTAPGSLELLDAVAALCRGMAPPPPRLAHTTLVLVATNAALDAAGCALVARVASTGFARTIAPVFTRHDGDVIVVASVGAEPADGLVLGQMAAEATVAAITRGVLTATSKYGLPCAADLASSASWPPRPP